MNAQYNWLGINDLANAQYLEWFVVDALEPIASIVRDVDTFVLPQFGDNLFSNTVETDSAREDKPVAVLVTVGMHSVALPLFHDLNSADYSLVGNEIMRITPITAPSHLGGIRSVILELL